MRSILTAILLLVLFWVVGYNAIQIGHYGVFQWLGLEEETQFLERATR